VTAGLMPPPAYFSQNVLMNQGAIPSLDALKENALRPLTPEQLEWAVESQGALVIDTRSPQTFKDAFVPRSINIGIQGDFAPWVGSMIPDVKQPLVLIMDAGTEDEVVTRLARVGYDNVLGRLEGGIDAWRRSGRETDAIESIRAEEFARRFAASRLHVVDVRRDGEFAAEHVEGARHAPLQAMPRQLAAFAAEEPNYVHCASGYRSMIAASLLKARGYHNVVEVAGGFNAIKKTSVRTVL
jgi:rhodanese-related sulfurtransferase